jgi:hypothetical protein
MEGGQFRHTDFFLFEDNLYLIQGLMAARKSTLHKNDERL